MTFEISLHDVIKLFNDKVMSSGSILPKKEVNAFTACWTPVGCKGVLVRFLNRDTAWSWIFKISPSSVSKCNLNLLILLFYKIYFRIIVLPRRIFKVSCVIGCDGSLGHKSYNSNSLSWISSWA